MKTEELTKEIYDKHPEVWNILKTYQIERTDLSVYTKCVHNQIMIMTQVPHSHMGILPFSMLYGLLVDFFEDNGIIITIVFDKYFFYKIDSKVICCLGSLEISKNEAKYQAILKACEILEGRL
jgi:hypothetical protein